MNEFLNYKIGSISVQQILAAALTLALCLIAAKIILGFIKKLFTKKKADAALTDFTMSALKVILYCLVIMITADKVGIPISSLIALLSVVTLAISLAAQGALSNIFGGVMLLINKPFKAGDYVEVNGVAGTVDTMTLACTGLVTVDNKRILVPNSEMSSAKITNYSSEALRRVDVDFFTAYSTSTELVKSAVKAAIVKVAGVEAAPAADVLLLEMGAGGIKYEVRVWCRNAAYWDVFFGVNDAVRKSLEDAGVVMGFSNVNVNMLNK